MLFLSCFCFRVRLFIDALWSLAGKGLTSWLSFVMSNCEVVTFPLVSWVRCGALLYQFLIFALFLTFLLISVVNYCAAKPPNHDTVFAVNTCIWNFPLRIHIEFAVLISLSRVGISGTTAKSRKSNLCSFVTSETFRGSGTVTEKSNKGRCSHLFWFFVSEWANHVKFHVDMIYLAKEAKRDVEKSFALRWEP